MKALLASSLGGSIVKDSKRVPSAILQHNGMLDQLKSIWPHNATVLIISADPDAHDVNDSICSCYQKAFLLSGLGFSSISICDNRNPGIAHNTHQFNVIMLSGGHVPTQNRFLKEIQLKEHLSEYDGILIAWSAGAMNCADVVYAGPELDGEAIDPNFERWLSGLGITSIKILPHVQSVKADILDGLRMMEDIIYPDSFHHELLAIDDGSYLMLDGSQITLYGNAYHIKNGELQQICTYGESIVL